MGDSTRSKSVSARKPNKPYADFPLYAHATRRWAKKVKGRTRFYGPWDDPTAALNEWLRCKDYHLAGREPPPIRIDAYTVEDACNDFCASKEAKRDAGEITPRSYYDFHQAAIRAARVLGKHAAVLDLTPDDFLRLRKDIAKDRGLVAQGNEIQRIRSIFKHAFDEGEIPTPVRFGQTFKKPRPDAIRKAREAKKAIHGDRMLSSKETRAAIEKASPALKAMILLGINCGFGATDCANLPRRAVDLEKGWVTFARVKTGESRRIPLWKETVDAISAWLAIRPEPKDPADEHLIFLTKYRTPWVKLNAKGTPDDSVGKEFTKLLKDLGLKRPGVSFYALRHATETIGGETHDQVAVNAIMGHVDASMAAHYRERIEASRLLAVTNHIRAWLFPADEEAEGGAQ